MGPGLTSGVGGVAVTGPNPPASSGSGSGTTSLDSGDAAKFSSAINAEQHEVLGQTTGGGSTTQSSTSATAPPSGDWGNDPYEGIDPAGKDGGLSNDNESPSGGAPDFPPPVLGADRKFFAEAAERADDPSIVEQFDADLKAYNEFKDAVEITFDNHVDKVMSEKGVDQDVAEHIVSMQFEAANVPTHALPDGVESFNPFEVLQDKNEVFDTARDTVKQSEPSPVADALEFATGNSALGNFVSGASGAGPDGFTSLDDLNAIIANPDQFDSDVVAAALVIRDAVDQPGNEELRAHFEKPSLWQQIQDSPWNDPNSDSFVVNLTRAAGGPGFSPAFIQRVINEGPGVLAQVDASTRQFTPQYQAQLLLNDPGQLVDNYKAFGSGLVDWFKDTGQLVVGSAALTDPVLASTLEQTTGVNVYQEAYDTVTGAGTALINDPDELARGVVGWDQFVNDPWRWAGNQAPDIIIEILATKGAGKLLKGADVATDVADAGRTATRVADGVEDVADAGQAISRGTDGATDVADAGTIAEDINDLAPSGVDESLQVADDITTSGAKPQLSAKERYIQLKEEALQRELRKELETGIEKADASIEAKLEEARVNGHIEQVQKLEAELQWLDSDSRHRELAYDPDQKQYKIDEAQSALRAEQEGIIEGKIKRDIQPNGRSGGADFVDADGTEWDHKFAYLDSDDPAELAELTRNENLLIDVSRIEQGARAGFLEELWEEVAKVGPDTGEIRIIGLNEP